MSMDDIYIEKLFKDIGITVTFVPSNLGKKIQDKFDNEAFNLFCFD